MAKWEIHTAGDFASFLEQVRQAAANCGTSVDLVEEAGGIFSGGKYAFLVYEKYYYRNNSYASLSLQLLSFETGLLLTAITAAAGGGLLNLDWGAADSFLTQFQKNLSLPEA